MANGDDAPSGNVRALHEYIDDETVELLRALLEKAEKGEIVGAYVVANVAGATRCYKSGAWERPKFLFALELAKVRIIAEAIAEGANLIIEPEDDDGA